MRARAETREKRPVIRRKNFWTYERSERFENFNFCARFFFLNFVMFLVEEGLIGLVVTRRAEDPHQSRNTAPLLNKQKKTQESGWPPAKRLDFPKQFLDHRFRANFIYRLPIFGRSKKKNIVALLARTRPSGRRSDFFGYRNFILELGTQSFDIT